MGVFLAEGYLASAAAEGLARDVAMAAAAAACSELTGDPVVVSCLAAVFLPSDQACLLIFEAASAEHVVHACRQAGLPCERVTAAVIARCHSR